MKFAYFVRPHIGGTFSVFTRLRAGLASRGVDVRWVAMEGAVSPKPGADDRACGFLIPDVGISSDAQRAARVIETLEGERFDGVFINVLAERLEMNIARYLPETMLRIMIVHTITPATYAAARAIRDSVHATVTVCERSRRDLMERHGFVPERIRTIANAVDVEAMAKVQRQERIADQFRLLFLGRIEDISKGVFWLPGILDRLPESVRLTVAGDGPDLPRLREKLAGHKNRVTFLGSVEPADVAGILARHDAMIMPSRFEGFGITIIEAMAAGCVPVVSRISGVTDSIVEHGTTGLLFDVGDRRDAAAQVTKLVQRPWLLASLSRSARAAALARFDISAMAEAYRELIAEIAGSHQPIAAPLPLRQWSIPMGMRPGFRTFLPRPVKNRLRLARERLLANRERGME